MAAEDFQGIDDFDATFREAGIEGPEEARGPPTDDGQIDDRAVVLIRSDMEAILGFRARFSSKSRPPNRFNIIVYINKLYCAVPRGTFIAIGDVEGGLFGFDPSF